MIDLMQQVLRPLAEKRWLDTWEKIVGFAGDDWFPSRLPFGKFKGRIYQEARENAAFLDLRIQEDAGGTSIAAGLVVFQQRSRGLVPGRRTMVGENWMPREAGRARLGLIFRVPLTAAPAVQLHL